MTSGKEDYLKAIYLLSENHDIVTNKELSQTLQVSPPSVSEMITKLQKQGYVDYTAYKGSKMTRKGRKEAGRLLRYHALWEVFLVNYLHFSWSQAHEMAEGLEHQTNDILSEKLEDIRFNGKTNEESAPHIISVSIRGVRAEVLLHALEDKEIYVSAGSACASNRPHVSETLKAIHLENELLESTLRLSMSVFTTKEQMDYTIQALCDIVPMLRRYSRQ